MSRTLIPHVRPTCSSGVAHLLFMGRRDLGGLVFVLYVGLEWIEGRVLDVPGR